MYYNKVHIIIITTSVIIELVFIRKVIRDLVLFENTEMFRV